jgi:hypothetical protein
MNIRKLITGTVLMFSVLFFGAVCMAQSAPYTCGAYNPVPPVQCILWLPQLLPGASWCNGDPAPGWVNLYQDINYGGVCETIPAGTSVADSSLVGWNNTTNQPIVVQLRIASFKTGSRTSLNIWPLANYKCPVSGPCGASWNSVADATKLYSAKYPTIGSFTVTTY